MVVVVVVVVQLRTLRLQVQPRPLRPLQTAGRQGRAAVTGGVAAAVPVAAAGAEARCSHPLH